MTMLPRAALAVLLLATGCRARIDAPDGLFSSCLDSDTGCPSDLACRGGVCSMSCDTDAACPWEAGSNPMYCLDGFCGWMDERR